jgi:hypothetical protein
VDGQQGSQGYWGRQGYGAITGADDLVRATIDGIQYVLDRPVRFWVTDEQKRILKAQRQFWQDATPALKEQFYNAYKQTGYRADPAEGAGEAALDLPENHRG